eukprot:TRINITY_DN22815_c1_g1_i1.p1 TRINITY_DN22815_c1_g1~~TRINITY_DN22815_c1_g1_i1.p1  ORF type:complete len:915 (-),score=82.62 TRINITY_DN22815_c1_g1_i1:277-3021(-)
MMSLCNTNLLQLCWGGEAAGNRWLCCCVICGKEGILYSCSGCPRQFHKECLLQAKECVAVQEIGQKQEIRMFCTQCQKTADRERQRKSQETSSSSCCSVEYALKLQQDSYEIIQLCNKLPRNHPGRILGQMADKIMEQALHPELRYLEARWGGVRELNENEDLEFEGKVPYDDPCQFLSCTLFGHTDGQQESNGVKYKLVDVQQFIESREEELDIAGVMGEMGSKRSASAERTNLEQNEYDYLVKNEDGRVVQGGGWGVQEVNAAPYGEGVKEAFGRDGICMPQDCVLTNEQVSEFNNLATKAYQEAQAKVNSYDGLPEDLERKGFQEIRMLFYNRWEVEVSGIRSRFSGPTAKPFPWNRLIVDVLGRDAQLYDAGIIVTAHDAPRTVPRPLESQPPSLPNSTSTAPPKSTLSSILVLIKLQDSHTQDNNKEDLVIEAHMGTHKRSVNNQSQNRNPDLNLKIKKLKTGSPVGRAIVLDGRISYNFLTTGGKENQYLLYLVYGRRDVQMVAPRSRLPNLPMYMAQDPRAILGASLQQIKDYDEQAQNVSMTQQQQRAQQKQMFQNKLQQLDSQMQQQQQQNASRITQKNTNVVSRARTGQQPAAPLQRGSRAATGQPPQYTLQVQQPQLYPQHLQHAQHANSSGLSATLGVGILGFPASFNQLISTQALGQVIGQGVGPGALFQQLGPQDQMGSLQMQLQQQQQQLQRKQQFQQQQQFYRQKQSDQLGRNLSRNVRQVESKQDLRQNTQQTEIVDLTLDDLPQDVTCKTNYKPPSNAREPPLKRMKPSLDVPIEIPSFNAQLVPKSSNAMELLVNQSLPVTNPQLVLPNIAITAGFPTQRNLCEGQSLQRMLGQATNSSKLYPNANGIKQGKPVALSDLVYQQKQQVQQQQQHNRQLSNQYSVNHGVERLVKEGV